MLTSERVWDGLEPQGSSLIPVGSLLDRRTKMEASVMTTTTETPLLNSDDVKALKDAQYVVLFYRPDGSEGPDWGMRIGYNVRLNHDGAEVRLARIVKSGLWTRTYADQNTVDFVRVMSADPRISQVEHAGCGIKEAVWLDAGGLYRPMLHVTSVLSLLKAGDSFGVHFFANNGVPAQTNAGMVRDDCYLRIRHGEKVSEFLMGQYVGPDNSARMVR